MYPGGGPQAIVIKARSQKANLQRRRWGLPAQACPGALRHSYNAVQATKSSAHMRRCLRLGAFSVAIIVLVACSVRLPDRSETAMACPSVSTDDHYFPIGFLEPRDSRGDAFRRRWYSSYLRAMGESSLSCGADSMETYRFLWLRAFHRPVSVRVAKRGDGAKLTVVELHGAGGDSPGTVASRREKELSPQDWAALTAAVRAIDFWSMPARSADDDFGLDGAQWILEGRQAAKYHVVDRWSPRTGSYREAGISFLKVADVQPPGQELD